MAPRLGTDDAVDLLARNPFEGRALHDGPEIRARVLGEHEQMADARELVLARMKLAPEFAVPVLLAVSQAGAGTNAVARLLAPFLPEVRSTLGAVWKDYEPVAQAALRCRDHLHRRIVGNSSASHRLRAEVWAATFGPNLMETRAVNRALGSMPVLLRGETGTGKELVAAAIDLGTLATTLPGPIPALNVSAIPADLFESEFFGVERGAYTGAKEPREGFYESAHGRAAFLDEIADLATAHQPKVLRTLETGEVRRVGAKRAQTRKVDVRVVSATHQPLEKLVEEKKFREDLFMRLSGIVIHVPPLRERRDDIPELARALVREEADLPDAENRVEGWLRAGDWERRTWRGNVRELFHVVRRVALGLGDRADAAEAVAVHAAGVLPAGLLDGSWTADQVRRWYVTREHDRREGNVASTARDLGMNRRTVNEIVGRRRG